MYIYKDIKYRHNTSQFESKTSGSTANDMGHQRKWQRRRRRGDVYWMRGSLIYGMTIAKYVEEKYIEYSYNAIYIEIWPCISVTLWIYSILFHIWLCVVCLANKWSRWNALERKIDWIDFKWRLLNDLYYVFYGNKDIYRRLRNWMCSIKRNAVKQYYYYYYAFIAWKT